MREKGERARARAREREREREREDERDKYYINGQKSSLLYISYRRKGTYQKLANAMLISSTRKLGGLQHKT